MKTPHYAMLLWMGLAATSAAGQDAASDGKLKVHFDNHTLSGVLDYVRDHSGYSLAYSPPLLVNPDGTPLRLTMRMDAEPIRVLSAAVKAADCKLEYLGPGNYIIHPPADRFSAAARGNGPATTEVVPPTAEPLVQKGAEQPLDQAFGTVYYPLPYASPPHLTLTPADRYVVVKQNNGSFTWLLRSQAFLEYEKSPLTGRIRPRSNGVSQGFWHSLRL